MRRDTEDALVVLDGTAIVYRAFHGGARWDAADGTEVGAVHAFGQKLARWLTRARSRRFAVVWDAAGDSFRKRIDPGYKAHRKAPPESLRTQIDLARRMTAALSLTSLAVRGFEADDLMATLASRGRADGLATWLVSPDKDLYQLVLDAAPAVRLFNPVSKTVFDEARVAATLGVPPGAAVDYFALAGDASDGVPGVRGVGPRTAVELIQAFGSLDGLYARLPEVAALPIRGAA
ncbi:MAG: DNA polymerase I, partial [Deltaproteobacteria bacterium]